LGFELVALIPLSLNTLKGRRTVESQIRDGWRWMVQNIHGIHTELHALRFVDPKRLAQRPIVRPDSRQFHVEDGKTTYEVELTVNGQGKDISIDAQGHVLEIEEETRLFSKMPRHIM
jgi:hypothetical protein